MRKLPAFPEIAEGRIASFFASPDENLSRYQKSIFPVYTQERGYEQAKIHLNKKANKPAFYLVHGLGATLNFFAEGTLFLREQGFEVFTHSKRGEISDEDDLESLSAETLVNDMEAQIEKAGIRDFHIIASSFGGILSLILAERRPDLIRSVTLIGSFLKYEWGVPHQIGYDILKQVKPSKLPATDMGGILPQMQFIRNRSVQLMNYILREYETLPVKSILRYVQYLKTMNYENKPPKVTCPMLILHGEHDDVVPLSGYRVLKEKYRDAKAILLKDCGHGPFLSRPDVVYKEIIQHAAFAQDLAR